jgi:hypothetical protein
MLEYLHELLKYQLELAKAYRDLIECCEDGELESALKENYKEMMLVNSELWKLHMHMLHDEDGKDVPEEHLKDESWADDDSEDDSEE